METPLSPAKGELAVGPVLSVWMRSLQTWLGVTGTQQERNPVSSRHWGPLAAQRKSSLGLKSDEARKVVCHIGAAGKDNLPSVLSGFTPVLSVTPECRITETSYLLWGGEGKEGKEPSVEGNWASTGLGEPHPKGSELESTWRLSGTCETVQQRCWEQLWEAHGPGCEGTASAGWWCQGLGEEEECWLHFASIA